MATVARGFVGRAAQLAELRGLLADAAEGRGELVVLTGEAGIGKTRLVRELMLLAPEFGAAVGWAGCVPDGAGPAFWPWTQLLRAIVDGDVVGDQVELGPASRLLVAGDGAEAEVSDPQLARFQLHDAVEAVLRDAAARRPLLMVVDDLQWADPPSLQLLTHITRGLPSYGVLLLATLRDEPGAVAAAGGELGELTRHGVRLALGGLSSGEVADLLRTRLAASPGADAVDAVYGRTGGNPLFVTELIRLAQAQGGRIEPTDVPPSVRAVVARRLGRLSAAARSALDVAAVLGTEFRLDALAATTGTDLAGALDTLDDVLTDGLVVNAAIGRYEFTHALVRDAIYADLSVPTRVRLHERVADALAALAAGGATVEAAELARHYAEAAPAGRAADAIHHARAAATEALALLAYEDAAAHYRRALTLLDMAPGAADRGELQLSLADCLLAGAALPDARTGYLATAATARAAGDAELLAKAVLGLGGGPSGFEVRLFDTAQVSLVTEAIGAITEDSRWRPWLLARLSVALSMDAPLARRLELSDQAIGAARAAGDDAALAYAMATRCDVIAGPADAQPRLADAAEIVRLASRSGDVRMELLGRRLRLVALLEIGDLSAADAEITAFERRAATIRQPLYGWYAPLWRGARAMMSGDLAEAQSWLAAAEAAGESAQSVNAMMLVGTHRALAYFETGRSDELAAMISSIVELFSGEPRTDVQVMTALARAAGGDLDGPRRFLDGLGITGLAALPADSEWLPCLVQVTYLVTLLGGHPVAGWLYDALLPHRRRHAVEGIGAFSHGSVERPLGLLAAAVRRREDARAHFEAALAVNRSAGAALLVARTLHDGGVAMGDAGWLAQARDAYRALGLEARAAEVDAALGTSGSSAETGTDAGAAFRRDGEVWALSWNGTTVRLGDRKGLADLAALLSRPGREVAALELAGAAGVELGGDLGELLDAPARAAYQRRIAELDAELADADEAGDQQRSTRATAEREALLAQLSAAYGLSRRPRRIGAAAERARQAVTARIRDALGRIEAAHPDLGAHLRRSVRTGTACVYLPDEPVTWRL